jgi:hypothetical protein
MTDDTTIVQTALADLIEGAKIRHVGRFMDDLPMQDRGIDLIRDAAQLIDRHSPNGRDVLLPLLSHEDPAVQVTAAGGLWQSHPDRAIPVLEHLKLYCSTEAGDTAMLMLFSNGQMNACGSDPRYPSLYGDEANAIPWGSKPWLKSTGA